MRYRAQRKEGPNSPNTTVIKDQFCPGKGQEEGCKEVAGTSNKKRLQIREVYAGSFEVLDMIDI